MPQVLLIHHSPTEQVAELSAAVAAGIRHPALDGAVTAVMLPALVATAADVEAADALALVTPVNFGYLSGALKHFFDRSYRALEGRRAGFPYSAVVKGTTDADGAVRALTAITTGLGWRQATDLLVIEGDVSPADRRRAGEIGAELAAALLL